MKASEDYCRLLDWVRRVNGTRGDKEGEELIEVLDGLIRSARKAPDGGLSDPMAWVTRIEACCKAEDRWMARRFIDKLVAYQRAYPAFKPERVADIFVRATPAQRARYCYQEIRTFTKAIHRERKYESLAASERD